MFLLPALVIMGWLAGVNSFGQGTDRPDPVGDSIRVLELIREAEALDDSGQPAAALDPLGQALQLAIRGNMDSQEAMILELIGGFYLQTGNAEESVPYFLRAGSIMEFSGDSSGMARVYVKTGNGYTAAEVFEKALEYYRRSDAISGEIGTITGDELTEKMGTAALRSGRYVEAMEYYTRYEKELLFQDKDPVSAWIRMVRAARAGKDFGKALEYTGRLVSHYGKQEHTEELALLENNMGFYLTSLDRYPEAMDFYRRAIQHAEAAGLSEGRISEIRANMGVCARNMGENEDAREYLNAALEGIRKGGYPAERSRIEHLQALIYFNENDLYNAGYYCEEAIESAERAGDPKRLSEACLTYSRVLRAGNDPVSALEYYEQYLAIRDSLQLEERLRTQLVEQRLDRMERSETDLLLRLREERLSELTINRLTLKLEREEQARDLLEKENELRNLEEERLRQSLVITQQQHQVEQQERQNRILEQEQRIARLALEQEQRKQKEAEQEIRLLEQQQRLDQLSLEKERQQRRALMGIVLLMILLILLITLSMVLTRKKNRLLARQKREIEEKNNDLEQKNEEISAQRDEIEGQRDEIEAQRDELEAQRDLLFDQKKAIEEYHGELMKSIEYAQRIQSATLPLLDPVREVASDYFVLFRPRDVVSGDFYWMAQVEGSTVLVVADCTGHGVPGAFMSVLGMSLLKEIVQKEYLTHPGVVLRRMRKEVIRALRQKGIPGEQRDGMDMSLVEIIPSENLVQYAGAYNSLYLVRETGLAPPGIEGMKVMEGEGNNGYTLYDIPADRMPVAFFDVMEKFTTRRIPIEKGDRLYLFTDGYADQFGGKRGKKFKYIPFKRLILESAGLSMSNQHQLMTRTLDEWKGDYEQIDDICVMGIHF